MVKLTDIARMGDVIKCNAYVEDCKEPIPLVFRIKDRSYDRFDLPTGYEYCDWHILIYAKRFLEQAINMEDIPREKLIMWY